MIRALCAALVLCIPAISLAQAPADPLSTCLADKTSGKDRKDLARWIFFSMGAHPEMAKYTSAEARADLENTQRIVGALVMRLLTVECAAEARQSYSKSGSSALEASFGVLGRLAMQELMQNSSVNVTLTGFRKFVDQKKINDVLAK